jgi:uncharacterized protein YjlB
MSLEYNTFVFFDDGVFPNNDGLELIVYNQPFRTSSAVDPLTIEETFAMNGWGRSWRNGLYDVHHYHSSAHEVLGLYSGWVEAQLGGPGGKIVTVHAGDVIIIPAGVSHKNIEQSHDFRVVGAYPAGQIPDMKFGKEGERPGADELIRKVPLPHSDPVFGKTGPLMELWR